MFKIFKDIGLQIVEEIFQFRDAMPYELRKQTDFKIPSVHSVFSGKESLNLSDPKFVKFYLMK